MRCAGGGGARGRVMEGRRRWESDRPVPTHLFAPGGARCLSQRTPSRSRRTHTPHTRHARLGGRAGGHPSDGPGDGPGDFGRKRERKKCDACSAVDASNLHSPAPRPAPSAPLNRRAGPRRIRPGLSHTRTRTRSHTHKKHPLLLSSFPGLHAAYTRHIPALRPVLERRVCAVPAAEHQAGRTGGAPAGAEREGETESGSPR